MNYFIFDQHTKATVFVGSLSDCYRELQHVAGYGIANATTCLPVVYRTLNGFQLPLRLAEAFPILERRLVNHCYKFNLR